jgi:type 1 glutamine amidotransferase
MSRSGLLARVLLASSCFAACSSGGATGPAAQGTGGVSGAAGAGATGLGGSAAAGTSGAGPTGGAGAGAESGQAGGAGPTGAGGAIGTGGSSAGAGSTTDAGGTAAAGGGNDGGLASDATHADAGGTTIMDAWHGNKVLLYTRSTGFVHGSTPTAAAAIAKAATAAGLLPEISADPAKFTPAQLAQYAAVVLIATAGEPLGSPGTTQIQALVDFVTAGGGLVAIENANHSYETSQVYMALMGGDFNGHSGYGPDTCYKDGNHPSVMRLPDSFPVVDEIYYFSKFRVDNQVVLRCGSDKRPISWVRTEGAGRFFYTALGHDDSIWMKPPLVDGHVLPGLLWSMGWAVP